ncbi:MDR family MFS transporter, partial [Streptomyces sp. SID14478]|uniref:MDR family MFS transporter n=1 Tax=Streptomyces sp. SID14478 TaxID=2706073 RepID=UPI001EF3CB9B
MSHAPAAPSAVAPDALSHRRILEIMSGLLLGMFVAILSSTVVSNALPTILADLKGGESAYTWMVTAQLIAMAASTPLWGKMSDLFSKKLLVQLALLLFVAASAAAGLAQSTEWLIVCRVFQGIGSGGLTALAQVILASIIAPRERGRYNGYLGAVFALGTISGPLIGGAIVDTSWLGWRWCFYVGVPFAVLALIVLQWKLKLPEAAARPAHRPRIDWAGAALITAAVCVLLIWVSLSGKNWDWLSWQTAVMVPAGVLLGVVAVLVERRAQDAVIPLELFAHRTVSLAAAASLLVGVAMFGATVFLSQYFQLARGRTPTESGLMTMPMILGLFLASTISGRIIASTGRWKHFLVGGGIFLTGGLALMGTVRADTAYWLLAIFMFFLGTGVGMTMQNLVLAVQNTVPARDLGAGSSLVAFVRTVGGAIGVSALGAVMSSRVATYTQQNLADAGLPAGSGPAGGAIPDLAELPPKVRPLVSDAFGHGIGNVFLFAAVAGVLALVAVCLIKETELRSRPGGDDGTDAAPATPDRSAGTTDRGGDEPPVAAGA